MTTLRSNWRKEVACKKFHFVSGGVIFGQLISTISLSRNDKCNFSYFVGCVLGWYEKLQSFHITILFGIMFYILHLMPFFIITCFWNFQNGGFGKKINLTVFYQYLPHFENFIEFFLSKFFKSNLWNQYFF